jgi:aspartate racemase
MNEALCTDGFIGGMSFEGSATYYRLINEGVRERLGGLNSAELILRSVNFNTTPSRSG